MDDLWLVVLLIMGIWLLFAIVIPFVLFPNYLIRPRIKETSKIKRISAKLKGKNQEQTLKNVYNFVIENHYGIRTSFLNKVRYFWTLFSNDVENNIGKKKCIWCHAQNILLKTILINTKQFIEEDIKIKWSVGFFIHQYLLVRIKNKEVKLDPFYKIYEVKN